MKTTVSILTRSQNKTYGPRFIKGYGPGAMFTATVHYDDDCGNGHNSFSVTAHVVTPASKRRNDIEAGGCMHEEIAQVFPELAPFIKWHLCESDGPMHYVANSLYWAGKTKWEKPNLKNFRATAIWPDATEQDMASATEASLMARLPALMDEFRSAVESLGFTY